MKTLTFIFILIVILTISGCVYFSDCNDDTYDMATTVAVDRTGSYMISLPDSHTVKQAFQFKTELWKGYSTRLVSLSDVFLNHAYEIKIGPQCSYTGNVYERKKQMENFSRELAVAIDKLLSEPVGRPSSSLFIPISKELVRLSEAKAKRKRLIIYSDLVEESALFKFYQPKTLLLLRENPDSVTAVLNKEAALPSLVGIEIYLVYQPVNSEDSERYRIISNFYKTMFEGKGARVNISANLVL